MPMSRRRILVAGFTVPGLLVLERAASLVGGTASGAIRAARPAPVGTTATRCAQCGAPDHTMLDQHCPLAPRVLS